jgi:4-hydroxy-tetrahydrodipicolinate reductase
VNIGDSRSASRAAGKGEASEEKMTPGREEPIRVAQIGLGPIGIAAARLVLRRPGLELVGACDIAPERAGRDLGEVLGERDPLGVKVAGEVGKLLGSVQTDVVILTTQSRLPAIAPTLRQMIEAGVSCVSSAEELLFPAYRDAALAGKLDALARKHSVSIAAAGVNPGFVMDILPAVLTGVCQEVTRIEATRVVDAGTRREPLQRKVGAGLSPRAFRREVEAGRLGHVGLTDSLAFTAHALGWWPLEDIEEEIEPVIAREAVETAYLRVEPGQVTGVHQVARGWRGGEIALLWDLTMAVGEADPHDAVHVWGTPPLEVRVEGGVAGDEATAATLVNAVRPVARARPGLLSPLDLLGGGE